MGILRSDLLTHSQLQPTGSVFFDGTDDKITTTGFGNIGTSDFTLECWVYLSTTSGTQRIISANEGSQSTEYTQIRAHSTHGWQAYIGTDSGWWEAKSGNDHATFTTGWHHVVLQRFGNDGYIFVDGEYVIKSQDGSSATNAADPVTITTFVLGHGYGSEYLNAGYISNARVSMSAVYGGTDFTPPKFELKPLGDTYLLCCQSSSSSSEAAVAPSAGLTVTGAAASSLTPDLKKDITDAGVVFDGFGSFATSTYMIPPSGKTSERNRGRGFIGAGLVNPSQSDNIDFLNIQSTGNTTTFGNLTTAKYALGSGASSTRGIFCGGYDPTSSPDTDINTIEYITIATEGNAIDFGDRTVVGRTTAAASSSTRVVMAAGQVGNPGIINTIDFITTATTGNASDFGDLLSITNSMCNANNSPTRGIFSGGNAPNSPYNQNVIQYVTMASAGNATDFGDLTVNARDAAGGTASSNTRGLILIGNSSPNNNLNTIDFVTIASTGNAADFGDIFTGRYSVSSCSNSNRAVFLGGRTTSPSVVHYNSMEFVTISTTGNTSDFGDITGAATGSQGGAANSDSHGGL